MTADTPMTVGALRAALADAEVAALPDDTPLRMLTDDDDAFDSWAITAVSIDQIVNGWHGGLEYQGIPYLAVNARLATWAEDKVLASPATTEDL